MCRVTDLLLGALGGGGGGGGGGGIYHRPYIHTCCIVPFLNTSGSSLVLRTCQRTS